MSLPGHVYGQQFILLTYSSWTSQSSRFLKNDRDGSKTLYPSQLVVWGIITEYQSLSLPGLVYGPTWVNYDILDIYVKKKNNNKLSSVWVSLCTRQKSKCAFLVKLANLVFL